MNPKKFVILPYEVKHRDLRTRCYLANELLKNNFNVILGEQTQIVNNLQYLPRGIYFEKSIAKNKIDRIKYINRFHKIVSLDEETLLSSEDYPIFFEQRFSFDTVKEVEKIFCWGNFDFDILKKKFSSYKQKFYITGNPRVDFWTEKEKIDYSFQTKIINEKYGNFILMPSSFGILNYSGEDYLYKQLKKFGIQLTSQQDKDIRNYFDIRKILFHEFVELAKFLSNKVNRNIVIRPHPSENIKKYKKIFDNHKNIFVDYKYDIAPWIKCCDSVVHSLCTTAYESILYKKRTICYLNKSALKGQQIKHLSQKVSKVASCKDEVFHLLNMPVDKVNFDVSMMKDYINNIDGEDCIKKIINNLSNISIDHSHKEKKPSVFYRVKDILKFYLKLDKSNLKDPNLSMQELKMLFRQFNDKNFVDHLIFEKKLHSVFDIRLA